MYGLFNELRSNYVSILNQLKNAEEERDTMKEERDTMTKKYDAKSEECDVYKDFTENAVAKMIAEGKSLRHIRSCGGLSEEDIRAIARERNLTIKADDTVLRA